MLAPTMRVGIWGYGVVGKSVYQFLQRVGITRIGIMDKVALQLPMRTFTQNQATTFFDEHDVIIPSPGIDIRPFLSIIQSKLITELDIVHMYCKQPIIAITGTVGKTSVTTLIGSLLNLLTGPAAIGGNIGTGACDFLETPHNFNYLVLETSDVQLKYTQSFAPHLSIWTNFSANHLDWHGSLDAYFNAKMRILLNQAPTQHALIPLELLPRIRAILPHRSFACFTADAAYNNDHLHPDDHVYSIRDHEIVHAHRNTERVLPISLNALPTYTYLINWLTVIAALDILHIPVDNIPQHAHHITLPAHRLEHVATIDTITIYNDSKGTTIAATQQAVHHLARNEKPIVLILGGLSKGVDRTPLIAACASAVRSILCFGAEADSLATIAQQYAIPVHTYPTLKELVTGIFAHMKPNDQILFSPAGSSWDQFTDYVARGNLFKQLILARINSD